MTNAARGDAHRRTRNLQSPQAEFAIAAGGVFKFSGRYSAIIQESLPNALAKSIIRLLQTGYLIGLETKRESTGQLLQPESDLDDECFL
jgi:hypothetical protein